MELAAELGDRLQPRLGRNLEPIEDRSQRRRDHAMGPGTQLTTRPASGSSPASSAGARGRWLDENDLKHNANPGASAIPNFRPAAWVQRQPVVLPSPSSAARHAHSARSDSAGSPTSTRLRSVSGKYKLHRH